MNAEPIIRRIVAAANEARLEVIVIGIAVLPILEMTLDEQKKLAAECSQTAAVG